MSVSGLVKRKRLARHLSQGAAATAAGLSQTTWNTFERGARATDPENIAAMAAALKITPEELENSAETASEYKAADVLREMSSTSGPGDLAARLSGLLIDPPAGYEVATWQTRDGAFHIEFRPLALVNRHASPERKAAGQ